MRYLPRSSLLPLRMSFLWYVMNTYYPLYNVIPSLVKMDTFTLSAVLPTLIRNVGNSSNAPDFAALLEICGNGSVVTYLSLHALPLATPNLFADTRNIGRPNCFLSFYLRYCLYAPESYSNVIASSF